MVADALHNRRANMAAMSLALAILLSACGSRETTVDLNRVKTLVAQHEYIGARDALSAYEAATGGNAASHRMMVDVLLGLGDGFAAEVYLKKLGPKDIGDAERQTLLAHSLIVRDRPFNAIRLLNDTLPKSAWTSETYRIAIWAHRAYERMEASEALLAEGLVAFPTSGQLLALDSRRLLDANDLEASHEQATRALSSDPNNFEARLVLAEYGLRQGNLASALEHYRAAEKIFPNQPLPKVNIIGILIDQNALPEAKARLAKARKEHPGFPLLAFQQARIQVLERDYLAAQRELNAAWGNLESYVPAQLLSARVSIALGNRDTAAVMLDRAAKDPRFAAEIEGMRKEFDL